MQIEIQIDPSAREPCLIVRAAQITPELDALIQQLSTPTTYLAGFHENQLHLLEPQNIVRIYAANGKVYAITAAGEYTLRQRLYELEAQLERCRFVRISNSEILNLKFVQAFDLRMTGTICARLTDGSKAYVSRRYIPKLKQILGI